MELMTAHSETIHEAVKDLKTRLGDSFQAFATRLGLSIASAARYADGSRKPNVQALNMMHAVALDQGHADLATVFQDAMAKEAGVLLQPHFSRIEVQVLRIMGSLKTLRTAADIPDQQRKRIAEAYSAANEINTILASTLRASAD
jgi:transcriptional regulator with XRE-family HTH domain